MKIGVDIRVLMDKQYSGISQYLACLLDELLQQDKENEYKLFYNSYKNIAERMNPWKRDNTELVASRYPNKIFNYILQKIFKYPKLDKALGGVDIFWSPHFNFSSISLGTKKIITVHDLSFLRYPEFFSVRKNFWHKSLQVKQAIKEADVIVAVSQNTKNDIIELIGIDEKKIRVVYSGNNVKKIQVAEQTKTEFENKFKLHKPFVLYLGNIEPRKNIVNLISAYNQLREQNDDCADIQLILAGGSGWKNKKIFKSWERSPYKKDIKFLGYVSSEEQQILYSRAKVFVFPSFYEGFGFPPLEAMTQGTPVICSDTSSLPEVVGNAAMLINPFKSEELCAAIKEIIYNKELRDRLVKEGYERAQLFTWTKTAKKYLELFKEICEQ